MKTSHTVLLASLATLTALCGLALYRSTTVRSREDDDVEPTDDDEQSTSGNNNNKANTRREPKMTTGNNHHPQETAVQPNQNTNKPVHRERAKSIPLIPVIPGLTNAQLARKLIADPLFQLLPASRSHGLESHIKKIMKDAMWDQITADIENKQFDKIIQLCVEMRDRLANITPHRDDLIRQIHAVVDVDLIRQQLANDGFGQDELVRMINAVIAKLLELESPGRNEDTKAWLVDVVGRCESGGTPTFQVLREFFDFFHDKVDLIQLDTANFHLRSLAPVMQLQGTEYYRELFEKQYGVSPGMQDLPKLEQWLADHRGRVEDMLREMRGLSSGEAPTTGASTGAEKATSSPSSCMVQSLPAVNGRDPSTSRLVYKTSAIHRACVFDLVWRVLPGDWAPFQEQLETLPETYMDEQDIVFQLQRQARALCRTGYFVMRLRQIEGLRNHLHTRQDVLPKLCSDLYDYLLSDIPPSVVDVGNDGKFSMVSVSSDQDGGPGKKLTLNMVMEHLRFNASGDGELLTFLESSNQQVIDQVQNALFPTDGDAVFGLIENRMKKMMLDCMSTNDIVESKFEQRAGKLQRYLEHKLAAFSLGSMQLSFVRFAMGILSFSERDLEIHRLTYDYFFEKMLLKDVKA